MHYGYLSLKLSEGELMKNISFERKRKGNIIIAMI